MLATVSILQHRSGKEPTASRAYERRAEPHFPWSATIATSHHPAQKLRKLGFQFHTPGDLGAITLQTIPFSPLSNADTYSTSIDSGLFRGTWVALLEGMSTCERTNVRCNRRKPTACAHERHHYSTRRVNYPSHHTFRQSPPVKTGREC